MPWKAMEEEETNALRSNMACSQYVTMHDVLLILAFIIIVFKTLQHFSMYDRNGCHYQ
jgi:hypothetical protein